MKKKQKKGWPYWTPRIISVVFILFMALFAFDVFGEYGGWTLLLALFMHLIPTLVLIIILIIAWKWELTGGIIYVLIGIVFFVFFRTYQDLVVFFLISFPWIVVGTLFIVNYVKNKR